MPLDKEQPSTSGNSSPAYDQAAHGHDVVEPGPLVLRFQLWHLTPRGRCLAYNERLAAEFHHGPIGPWTVKAVSSFNSDNESERDHFVPVEVDFHHAERSYNDPDGVCKTQVRDVFIETVPRCVGAFPKSIKASSPAMNMYPIAVPDDYKRYYTHVRILAPLQSVIENPFHIDQSTLPARISYRSGQALDTGGRIEWREASKLLLKYRGLIKFELLSSPLKEQRLGNQDLYQLLMDLGVAILGFESVERQMRILADTSIADYDDRRDSSHVRKHGHFHLVTGVAAAVATVCWWHPVGWFALKIYGVEAAVAVEGAVLKRIGSKKIEAIEKKKENVAAVLDAMQDVRNSFNQAHTAATILFLSQVLHTPLSCLGNHEKKQILAALGIELDAMKIYTDFNREELFDRLKKFWADNERLFDSVELMMKDGDLTWAT
ncbi:hypothetical protein PT974_05579 [Cladobotryum mycophilum]|uniref:Uncharacterized protein n=1 Tax=Cladobotryum mycophilum TaxID=491253 RepID=A0ABR0SJG3_9HYPO